jgi:hypothetical protein
MGLALDPLCAACGLEEESAIHFLCICPSLSNIRIQILGKPILSVGEYAEKSAISFLQFVEKSGRFWDSFLDNIRFVGCTLATNRILSNVEEL